MNRTISSFSPFGAKSDSMSVREAVLVPVDVERPDLRDRLLNGRHQPLLKLFSGRSALAHAAVDGSPGEGESLDVC